MELNTIKNTDCLLGLTEIADKSVDLVITDPPYLFNNGSGGGAFGTTKRNYHQEYLDLIKLTGKTRKTERLRIKANGQE